MAKPTLSGKFTVITGTDRAMLNALLKKTPIADLAPKIPISEKGLQKWLDKDVERFRGGARVRIKELTEQAKKPRKARVRTPLPRVAREVNGNGSSIDSTPPAPSPTVKKRHRTSVGIRPIYTQAKDLVQDLEGTAHHGPAVDFLRDLALYAMDQATSSGSD